MFHVKQIEGGSRFGLSVGGRAGLNLGLGDCLGACCVARVACRASGEAVRCRAGVSRETHVYVLVSVAALRLGRRLIL